MKIGSNPPSKMPNIVTFDSDELPDIKNWQPKKRYRIVIDVEQIGLSTAGHPYLSGPDDKRVKSPEFSAQFRVLSAKPQYGGGAPTGNSETTPAKLGKSDTMSALQRRSAA